MLRTRTIWLVLILLAVGALIWWLSLVFSGTVILPQTLSLGPLSIHYYGIFLALAIASAYQLAKARAEQFGYSLQFTERVLLWVLVGGFIGARLYHVFSEYNYYFSNPLLIPAFWQGGLSIIGAILGGGISLLLWYRYQQSGVDTNVLNLLDWLAPSIVMGQIIGRFGNLFNYEAYGYPTNLPWKMFVPWDERWAQFSSESFFHPLFLYESLGNLLILVLLLKIIPKCKLVPGMLFFSWLFLYNTLRFGLEHLRIDSTYLTSQLRLNALVAAILAAFAVSMLIWLKKLVSGQSQNSLISK